MRKKRLLSLALVAALSVTMLAGCGGKKPTESETGKDGSDKVTITLGIKEIELIVKKYANLFTIWTLIDKKYRITPRANIIINNSFSLFFILL